MHQRDGKERREKQQPGVVLPFAVNPAVTLPTRDVRYENLVLVLGHQTLLIERKSPGDKWCYWLSLAPLSHHERIDSPSAVLEAISNDQHAPGSEFQKIRAALELDEETLIGR